MRPARLALAAALLCASKAHALDVAPLALVFCAPGYPGTAAEAEPAMAALAKAVSNAGERVEALYAPTEKECLALLDTRRVAIVTLPFFVKHSQPLHLTPHLVAEQKGLGPNETWTLVAKKGRVANPADVAGLTVLSIAGYAPGFVRAVLGPAWRLPEATVVKESTQVLSALRRAAQGEDVAVLLDGAQGNALASLPFAAELGVVARSTPLPAALVTTVGNRMDGKAYSWPKLEKALLALPKDAAGAAALEGIRMVGFSVADKATLQAVRALSGPAR